jgi:hypothetical protein
MDGEGKHRVAGRVLHGIYACIQMIRAPSLQLEEKRYAKLPAKPNWETSNRITPLSTGHAAAVKIRCNDREDTVGPARVKHPAIHNARMNGLDFQFVPLRSSFLRCGVVAHALSSGKAPLFCWPSCSLLVASSFLPFGYLYVAISRVYVLCHADHRYRRPSYSPRNPKKSIRVRALLLFLLCFGASPEKYAGKLIFMSSALQSTIDFIKLAAFCYGVVSSQSHCRLPCPHSDALDHMRHRVCRCHHHCCNVSR